MFNTTFRGDNTQSQRLLEVAPELTTGGLPYGERCGEGRSSQREDSVSRQPIIAAVQEGANGSNIELTKRLVTLKRIPKGARGEAAKALLQSITSVLRDPSSKPAWLNLFDFAPSCFVKPGRGGKSRNLTTKIIQQIRAYEHGEITHTSGNSGGYQQPGSLKADPDVQAARRAAAKLEEGSISAAVRILNAREEPLRPCQEVYEKLLALHPKVPQDRRPCPPRNCAPIQTSNRLVKKAITTFPNGSSGGPDGLRPQHLKDLTSDMSIDHPLMEAITDLVNLMLRGECPEFARGALFGCTLVALPKKDAGVRPIAIGTVWRRIAGKVACNFVTGRVAARLAPKQLGVGVSNGLEACIHTTRAFLENRKHDQLVAKIDFRNAFNCLRRDCLLEAVASQLPELLNFVINIYGHATDLYFGEHLIISAEGTQQGDPLGPLLFAITTFILLQNVQSELSFGYLDDVTLGGDAGVVAGDILRLESEAGALGLQLNRSKCEIIGHSPSSRRVFESYGLDIKETKTEEMELLGAPMEAGSRMDAILSNKVADLKFIGGRLQLMSAHDGLVIIKSSLSANRVLFLLRTSPCFSNGGLEELDNLQRSIVSSVTNIHFTDMSWTQATLPIRWGGLGIRSAASLALPAFLASAAGTVELTNAIFPAIAHHEESDHIRMYKAAWQMCIGSQDEALVPLRSQVQHALDDQLCKHQASKLLEEAHDDKTRARLLAAGAPHSGAWLQAIPIASIGLKLSDEVLRIAVGLRLGAAVILPQHCKCGSQIGADGLHSMVCKMNPGRHVRHRLLNDAIKRALSSAGVPSTLEPKGLCADANKRPDGVTTIPWRRGRCIAWDVTCPETLAISHIASTSALAGQAATAAELNKITKYADMTPSVEFVPIAVESLGVWGAEGLHFVNDIGRRIADISHEPRSSTFLLQRLSIAIQRGNACCVLHPSEGTVPEDDAE